MNDWGKVVACYLYDASPRARWWQLRSRLRQQRVDRALSAANDRLNAQLSRDIDRRFSPEVADGD